MEDVQYHLTNLFKFVKKNLGYIPEAERSMIEGAANATQKALDASKAERRNYAVMVQRMREGQRAFFKAQREKNYQLSSSLLTQSRINESNVDQRTIEIVQGVKQPDLFK